MIRLSLLWFACAIVITPIAWGIGTSLAGAILFGRETDFGPNALQAAIYAVMLTPLITAPYALALFAWPKLINFFPAAEQRLRYLALTAAILASPPAVIVGWSYAPRYPFWVSFLCAFEAGWLGLFLPRVLVSVLRPGAFHPSKSRPISLRTS